MAASKALAVVLLAAGLLLAALAAPARSLDLPRNGCRSCRGATLAYADLPPSLPNTPGLTPYFHFDNGTGGRPSNSLHESINYVHLYATSGPMGSGAYGKSIADNLLPASELPHGIGSMSSAGECCAACAGTPSCAYYAFYPGDTDSESNKLTGWYAVAAEVPANVLGRLPGAGDATLAVSVSFPAEAVRTLPPGIRHRCSLMVRHGNGLSPVDYSFRPAGATEEVLAANPKVILGGSCNEAKEEATAALQPPPGVAQAPAADIIALVQERAVGGREPQPAAAGAAPPLTSSTCSQAAYTYYRLDQLSQVTLQSFRVQYSSCVRSGYCYLDYQVCQPFAHHLNQIVANYAQMEPLERYCCEGTWFPYTPTCDQYRQAVYDLNLLLSTWHYYCGY